MRDTAILSIMPTVAIDAKHNNTSHQFQDEVLRPILKFQHEPIIFMFNHFIINHKIEWTPLSYHKKNMLVEHLIKTNNNLKEMMKGIVFGCFTNNNLLFWQENKIEINKRIIQLLIKRIQSTIEK